MHRLVLNMFISMSRDVPGILDDARRSNGAAGVRLGRLRPLRHAKRVGDGEKREVRGTLTYELSLTNHHIEYHHQNEANGAEVGVLTAGEFLNHDVEHGSCGKCKHVRHDRHQE